MSKNTLLIRVSHSDTRRNKRCFDIRKTKLTFGAEYLRSELQSLNVLWSDVLQTNHQVLRLSVEQLNGHCAGQLFFGHWRGCVGWPAQVYEDNNKINYCFNILQVSLQNNICKSQTINHGEHIYLCLVLYRFLVIKAFLGISLVKTSFVGFWVFFFIKTLLRLWHHFHLHTGFIIKAHLGVIFYA